MSTEPYILACKSYLSESWKPVFCDLLVPERWNYLCKCLSGFIYDPEHSRHRKPEFFEEIKIPYSEILPYFEPILNLHQSARVTSPRERSVVWAQVIENCPFEYLLSIMGQRFTPASLKDAGAIPPVRSVLMESAFAPYNDQISMVTRAWEKHVGRDGYDSQFWGVVEGNPTFRESKVKEIVQNILDNSTWWNIFNHFQHGLVYEARIETGYGLRWNQDGTKFIGLLGPFLSEEEARSKNS